MSRFAPVAVGSSVRSGSIGARQGIVVTGRDYVANVTATSADGNASPFATPVYKVIRPSDVSIFSWMSKLASCFQTYKFMKMRFVYEPQAPSTTQGSVILYFSPDPTTSAAANWSVASQRGVATHGACWAKHALNIPLSLCSSRREYYVKDEFPPFSINSSLGFSYDPLEYYVGAFGCSCEGVRPAEAGSAFTAIIGKIYVEYSIGFGKATDEVDEATNYAGTTIQNPDWQKSKAMFIARTATTNSNPANQILFGANAPEKPNSGQALVGFQLLSSSGPDIATNVWRAPQDVEFKLIISLSSLTGNWTGNPVQIGVGAYNADPSQYTWSATALDYNNQPVVRRVYDAGTNTTAYFALYSCRLPQGTQVAVRMSSSPGSTAWYSASGAPSYMLRFYSASFSLDLVA